MSKKGKVIHVDKLIIHAKEVEIIQENREQKRDESPRRNPWGFWGPRSPGESIPSTYPQAVGDDQTIEETSSLDSSSLD